jgi:hypothetical protein
VNRFPGRPSLSVAFGEAFPECFGVFPECIDVRYGGGCGVVCMHAWAWLGWCQYAGLAWALAWRAGCYEVGLLCPWEYAGWWVV